MICLMPLGDFSEELALSKAAKLRRKAFHWGKMRSGKSSMHERPSVLKRIL